MEMKTKMKIEMKMKMEMRRQMEQIINLNSDPSTLRSNDLLRLLAS